VCILLCFIGDDRWTSDEGAARAGVAMSPASFFGQPLREGGAWVSSKPVKQIPLSLRAVDVLKILSGSRTQLRSIVKDAPNQLLRAPMCDADDGYWWGPWDDTPRVGLVGSRTGFKCPYGKVGDFLWVREVWTQPFRPMHEGAEGEQSGVIYRADGPEHHNLAGQAHSWGKEYKGWKLPRAMPRWASRLTLEVGAIRCEKLQPMNLEDAQREGFESLEAYAKDWDKRHSREGIGATWAYNPIVWVVQFRVVPPFSRRSLWYGGDDAK
jgi:hypothetical protein